MKLYIPSVGDELKLIADFHFKLYNEYRNESLKEVLGDKRKTAGGKYMDAIHAKIPAGEVLKVDRIYIRKGLDEFDSITFLWKGMRTEPRVDTHTTWDGSKTYQTKVPRKPVRFWVKLEDANTIEFEKV